MSCKLPADCLNEIFEYFEQDKTTLYSCLLVSCLWCEISVRILWRDVFNIERSLQPLLSTIIACLPNESREFLHNNDIFIATPTSKPSFFNYARFLKVLSIHNIDEMIQQALEQQQSTTSATKSLNYCKYLILQEILKMFMKQIPSLKELKYNLASSAEVSFMYFPGATNCLKDLRALSCSSEVHSEFFYQLSQICHNIQLLTIGLEVFISNGLNDLISSQNGIKCLSLVNYYNSTDWKKMVPSLLKHSNSLVKLKIHAYGELLENCGPLSFIPRFTNLQELVLSFDIGEDFTNDLDGLQYANFPQLKILKFPNSSPKVEVLTKFLENHGKNLTEFHFGSGNNFNLTIAKLCPNLKSLFTLLGNEDIETLKIIFKSCQHLESFKFWYGFFSDDLSIEEFLDVLAKYSPKNFHELKIHNIAKELTPEVWEPFFVNWMNRVSQRPLSITIIKWCNSISEKNIEIIEKYKKLGVIKKFEVKYYETEEYENNILL